MSIISTFSKRKKLVEKAGKPDIFQYAELPQQFRVQATHIIADALGFAVLRNPFGDNHSPTFELWFSIFKTQCREQGVYSLSRSGSNPQSQCLDYILQADTDQTLDIIELSLRVIEFVLPTINSSFDGQSVGITLKPQEAIADMNARFMEHNLGYQYTNNKIVRVDSEFIHREIVQPAMRLLNEAQFSGASDEFVRAFDHYRYHRYKEAINEAAKAFESTMKTICDLRRWTRKPGATARDLIQIMLDKGIVPPEMATHFSGLRSALESGLPTVRNKNSAHGQGLDPIN